jgi:hypothetical protein
MNSRCNFVLLKFLPLRKFELEMNLKCLNKRNLTPSAIIHPAVLNKNKQIKCLFKLIRNGVNCRSFLRLHLQLSKMFKTFQLQNLIGSLRIQKSSSVILGIALFLQNVYSHFWGRRLSKNRNYWESDHKSILISNMKHTQ